MKSPVVAAILLVLAVPANARMHHDPLKKDVFDLFTLYHDCTRFDWTDNLQQEQTKACNELERVMKKLNAQGYCAYGHVSIGRSGKPWTQKELERIAPRTVLQKGERHCLTLKPKRDAKILQYVKQYETEDPYSPILKQRCKKYPELPVCKVIDWEDAQ